MQGHALLNLQQLLLESVFHRALHTAKVLHPPISKHNTGKTKWHSQARFAVTYNHAATPEGTCCKLGDSLPKCKLSPFTCVIVYGPKQAFWKWFHRLYD